MKLNIRVIAAIVLTSTAFDGICKCKCQGQRGATGSQRRLCVVPKPTALGQHGGRFCLTSRTRVVAQGEARAEAVKLIDYLAPAMGYRLKLSEDSSSVVDSIHLRLEPSSRDRLGQEGYELEVKQRSILVVAAEPAGLFYGIQTLRQLLPPAIFSPRKVDGVDWAVPCVRIVDRPRFKWRGLLIDPARHFVIKRYPKLTELGSKMDWTFRRKGGSGPRCSGFYTQEQIRRIVRYAADRHITIVPEIEMPFHTAAAIVAYPELGINTAHLAELPPEQRWGRTKGLIAPRPKTVAFLQNVLAEVIELFPGKYIHIGGDEADTRHWARDLEMQAQIVGSSSRWIPFLRRTGADWSVGTKFSGAAWHLVRR